MATLDSPPTTAPELSSALSAAGTLRHGSIVNLAITKQIQTDISHLWFLEVVYAADCSPKLPTRLVVKWPIENSAAPDRGGQENVFYRQLAPSLPSPPVLRCLASAPPESHEQWMILEDLRASHSNPPWPERPRDSEVHEAVAALAQLHARWWEAPTLGSTVGTLHTETSLRAMVYGISSHLPGFVDDLGEDLPLADRLLLETIFNSALRPWFRLVDRRGLTVVHGDAHTWNFLFPRSGEGGTYIFDWQLWHLDVGPRDLAFMIALHWDAEVRKQFELPLLHFYHDKLNNAGISNYSFEELLLDYRRCVVRNLTFPLIQWARGLRREAWRYRLDCALAAYRDLNAAELL